MQAIGLVGRFQSSPKGSHLNAVKTIFRYLQGTIDYGLWYPRGINFTRIAYIDTDCAGSIVDK